MTWWELSITNVNPDGVVRWDEEYRLTIPDDRRRDINLARQVRSLKEGWEPFRFEYRPQDRLKGLDVGYDHKYYKPDFTNIFPLLWMFSARAVEVLRPLIEKDVEILPLICDTDEVYAVNIVSAPKAVNLRRSKRNRHGRLLFNELHVNRRKLRGYNMFRLYDYPFAIIVTDAVKEAIEAAELTGAACVKWLE
jgi:hypothetical protein